MASYGGVGRTGVLWGVLGRVSYEFASIPTAMVMARLLTPRDFGVGAAVGFFVQIAQRFTDFGFTVALMRRQTLTDRHTSTVFYVNLLLGLSAWLVLTVTATWMGDFFRSPEAARALPVAGLSFVFAFLGSVPQMLIIRDLRFRASAGIDMLNMIVASIVALTMAWYGFGYWSLIVSQVVAGGVQTVVRYCVARWRPKLLFSREVLSELWSIGVGLQAKRLLDSLALNVDNMVVARTLGLAPLGFYDKAFAMMSRAVAVLNSAAPAVSFRIFAIIYTDRPRFRAAYRKVLLGATVVAYPAFTWLIVVAPDLFLLMFGRQWTSAVLPFRILCLSGLLKILNTYASTATQAVGWIWREVWRQGLYVFLIVAGVALGSAWGVSGAAAGVLAASAIMTGLAYDLLRRAGSFAWSDFVWPQLPGLAGAAGLAVLLNAVRVLVTATLGRDPIHYEWLLLSASTTVVYGLAFLRFNRFEDLRALVADAAEDLPSRFAWIGRLVVRQQTSVL
jgi:PST family polysaccharide transporter